MNDSSMLEIHIRISKRLILWSVGVVVAFFALGMILSGAWFGHASGGVQVGSVQQVVPPIGETQINPGQTIPTP
jgi:hypothetical protein